MVEVYCTSAMPAEITTNSTIRPRIQVSWLFSGMFLITLPFKRSSVSVEEDVSTNEESVDMEAERTSTTTMPSRISGRPESMVGIMES